jgi:hypothetical protein
VAGIVIEAKPMPATSRQSALDRVGCELIAESLRAGRSIRMRALGSSMMPALRPGDDLLVNPLTGSIPSRGEIVLFTRDGRLFAHRVVAAGEYHLITRGDCLDDDDPPVPPSQILGTVASVFRGGREVAPPAEPSRAQTIMSSALRRSDLLKRVVLKIHAIRHPSMVGA